MHKYRIIAIFLVLVVTIITLYSLKVSIIEEKRIEDIALTEKLDKSKSSNENFSKLKTKPIQEAHVDQMHYIVQKEDERVSLAHQFKAENLDDNTKLNFSFEEKLNDYSLDLSGINKDLISSGRMFSTDLSKLKSLPLNSSLRLTLSNRELTGKIEKKIPSKEIPGNLYMKVSLGKKGHYMTAYFHNKSTKGKIYSENGSYMYEHNGETGFIISIYDYKKMNDALKID